MKKTLICASIAYDSIMVFSGRFKDHILPDQVHILNVSFLVPTLRREFGGVAGNIAYSLAQLGGNPAPLGTIGVDGADYLRRLDTLGIDRSRVLQIDGTHTAQAFITTDLDDNQITAFHPGAMNMSHLNSVAMARQAALGIVAPDGREGMIQHAREFAELDIPFVFDPGQGMPMFSGAELLAFIEQATYVTVNDYEAKLLQDKTGKTLDQIAQRVKALIVTLGADGSLIYADGNQLAIPTPKPKAIVDPTGCGDAYRAGLLHGIQQGWDWQTTGRLASLMGSLKIAYRGGQNHKFTRAELAGLYEQHFGHAVSL